MKVGYNPDSFGHNGNLPQILKKSGIDFYLFCRPAKHEKKLPQVFWWEGPDGSKILACRPPFHYNSTDENLEKKVRNVAKNFYGDLKDVICMIGFGNHGGGPTRRSIEIIKKLQKDENLPDIIYSTPYRFFRDILKYKKNFPVVKDELQYHARGCYTSYPQIKKFNRIAENKVITAESISSFNFILLGEKYNSSEIEDIWREILFNQFHDILAGSSIPEAYFDSLNMLGKAIISSERIINRKLWSLSKMVDTEKVDGNPVLFFNPTSFEREEIKKVSLFPGHEVPEKAEVLFYDEKGKRVPSQPVEDVNTSLKNYMVKVKIPPFGYKVYWWRVSEGKRRKSNLKMEENSIENQILKIVIDEESGGIKNLFLKEENWNSFKKTGGEFLVIEDPSDAWGHGQESFRKVAGKFKCEEIIKGEEGECMVSVRCKAGYNNSEIFLEYILYDNLPFVEVKGKINWQEKHKFLKVSFPVNLEKTKIFVEMPYYFIERKPDGKENPCHRWIDITGKFKGRKFGLSIVNSEWYGYDFDGSELRMSVLRSPVFGAHRERK
ncbi:MAG TPA: hypothetical protein ENF61_02890, partial [Firmicutes bacterium]|nr:hypothetical protein [Bacillota bacterium]